MTKVHESIGYKTYAELLSQFKDFLIEKCGDSLLSMVVFGSIARGKGCRESDIDLLIVLKEAPQAYYERLQPVVDIEHKIRRLPVFQALTQRGLLPCFSTLILSQEEAKENRYIFLDMIEDSIILFDQDGFFARRLRELKERLTLLGSEKVFLPDGSWYWDLKPDLKPGEAFEL